MDRGKVIVLRNGSKMIIFEPSDLIDPVEEYMGSDAARCLENIIQNYKDEIEGLEQYIDTLQDSVEVEDDWYDIY